MVDGIPEPVEGLDTPIDQGGNVPGAASEAAPAAASSVLSKRSASAKDGEGGAASSAAPMARNAADELAERLAAYQRNPRILPAACWFPNAESVLAVAQASRTAAGLPPLAPSLPNNAVRSGANSSASPEAVATLPPPPPHRRTAAEQTTSPAASLRIDDEDSSSDMDDDALVAAYITPPASPTASPRYTRPASGQRRGSNRVRSSRAGAAAARASVAVQDDDERSSISMRDLHQALRNGFSSVRRELTRFRTELVVVKSQSASVLRRVDGLSAAADGSHSGNGAVLERLAQVQSVVNNLGSRLQEGHAVIADGSGVKTNSASVIHEIKVSSYLALWWWAAPWGDIGPGVT